MAKRAYRYGLVTKFDESEGCGFINPCDGVSDYPIYFVRHSGGGIKPGRVVEFDVVVDREGWEKAVKVIPGPPYDDPFPKKSVVAAGKTKPVDGDGGVSGNETVVAL